MNQLAAYNLDYIVVTNIQR